MTRYSSECGIHPSTPGTTSSCEATPTWCGAFFGVTRPRVKVRGRDTAGEVVAVGAAVTRLQIGDEVYCESSTGSYAEFTRVPEKFVAFKPESLTLEQAGCVPVAAVTALQGLRKVGKVEPGQQVLIIGASGGVGSYAVQIAKALGPRSRVSAALPRSIWSVHSEPMPSSTTQPNRSVITMANST